MNFAIILLIIVAIFFVSAFVTKRRFGVLGLALCAGSMLSSIWSKEVTLFIEGAGVELMSPPLSVVVATTIVLLPAIFMLFRGPTYSKRWQRLVGSMAFALLAMTFLLTAFGNSLSLDENGMKVYSFLTSNKSIIITVGIVYALYDVITYKTPKKKDKE
ncbi:MAG: hypothetical protein WAW80_03060 [Candidatus Saccharimonadales bacterium]